MSVAAMAGDWLEQPIRVSVADFATPGQLAPPRAPEPVPPRWRDWAMLLLIAVLAFQTTRGCEFRPDDGGDVPRVKGLRVLILEESADRATLPDAQQQIFGSVPLREAIADAKGELLILDKDDDTARLSAEWRALRDHVTKSTPAIIVATPRRVTEAALPADVAATIQFLERVGK